MNQTKIHPRWASATNLSHSSMEDRHILSKQLMREITCLERQLSRLNLRPEIMPPLTIKTYEDMITSRKAILIEVDATS